MSSQDVSRCNHASLPPIFAGDLLDDFGLEKRLILWCEAAHLLLFRCFLCCHSLAHQDGPWLPSGSFQDLTEGVGCTLVSVSLEMDKTLNMLHN